MDKNCVRRREAPGELAEDSEAPKGSERLYVNAARIRGKLSYLIRGDLQCVSETRLRRSRGLLTVLQKSAEAEVVDGVTTIQGEQGNLLTGRRAERQTSLGWNIRGTSIEGGLPRIGDLLVGRRRRSRWGPARGPSSPRHQPPTKARGLIDVLTFAEPPDADPHVRWCGRGEP